MEEIEELRQKLKELALKYGWNNNIAQLEKLQAASPIVVRHIAVTLSPAPQHSIHFAGKHDTSKEKERDPAQTDEREDEEQSFDQFPIQALNFESLDNGDEPQSAPSLENYEIVEPPDLKDSIIISSYDGEGNYRVCINDAEPSSPTIHLQSSNEFGSISPNLSSHDNGLEITPIRNEEIIENLYHGEIELCNKNSQETHQKEISPLDDDEEDEGFIPPADNGDSHSMHSFVDDSAMDGSTFVSDAETDEEGNTANISKDVSLLNGSITVSNAKKSDQLGSTKNKVSVVENDSVEFKVEQSSPFETSSHQKLKREQGRRAAVVFSDSEPEDGDAQEQEPNTELCNTFEQISINETFLAKANLSDTNKENKQNADVVTIVQATLPKPGLQSSSKKAKLGSRKVPVVLSDSDSNEEQDCASQEDDSSNEDLGNFLCRINKNNNTKIEKDKQYIKEFKLMHKDGKDFKFHKEEISNRLFFLFNKVALNGYFSSTNAKLSWSSRLTSTAGQTKCTRDGNCYSVSIELSTKIVNSIERLRDTLSHEMAHAAVWIIDRNPNDNHGERFKYWANRISVMFPGTAASDRCHNYDIDWKYTFACVQCQKQYHRNKNTIDVTKHRCQCGSEIVEVM